MFARYEELKTLKSLGEANFQLQVLTTVADVTNLYYNLVQQQHQLEAYLSAIDISRYRVRTAQSRFQIGKAARLEVLNALVDLNTDTTNFLRQQEQHRNTQINLNELLARDVSTTFVVIDTINIDNTLTLPQLSDQALQQNPSLRAALLSRRIAELDLKQVRADRYPRLGVNSGYNFSRSESPLGFAILNTGRGFNYGLTASVNIFNGFLQRQREKNAELLIENAQIDYNRVNQSIKAQLAAAFQTYQTNLSLVKLVESNLRIAKQNLDITLDKYKLGTITQVEVRDAQLNYINAQVRYSNAQYQAKLAEIALKEITGTLNLKV
jgi:outer membrane protein TolC